MYVCQWVSSFFRHCCLHSGKKHTRESDGEAEQRPKPSRSDDSDDERKKSRRKRSDDESDGDDGKKRKRHYKKKPISADHYDSASD